MKPNDLLVLRGSCLLIIVTITIFGAQIALAEAGAVITVAALEDAALAEAALAEPALTEVALRGHDDDDGPEPLKSLPIGWSLDDSPHCYHEVYQGCARPTFHFETETEIFGCGYQKLRLRLLVVGIKSQD